MNLPSEGKLGTFFKSLFFDLQRSSKWYEHTCVRSTAFSLGVEVATWRVMRFRVQN